ncbi:hypothetical protein LINPERHAP2_LOCUS19112 [Linum perenne]
MFIRNQRIAITDLQFNTKKIQTITVTVKIFSSQRRTISKKKQKSTSVSEFIFQSFFNQSSGFGHQIRAKLKHKNTRLHFIQSSSAVEIPFAHHPGDLLFRQVLQAKDGSVQPQARRRDDASVFIHK